MHGGRVYARYVVISSLFAGFYGDPSLGSGIPCRECMCPGGQGSGYQHADKCILEPFTNTMLCDCPPQFAGRFMFIGLRLLISNIDLESICTKKTFLKFFSGPR